MTKSNRVRSLTIYGLPSRVRESSILFWSAIVVSSAQKLLFEVVDSPKNSPTEGATQEVVVFHPTSQYQLALNTFGETGNKSNSIADSPQEITFIKSKQLIDVSDLGLLSKKALNVCHFLASGMPDQDFYEIDLGFFRWMLKYKSRNLDHLRLSLRECQKSAAQVLSINEKDPERDNWVSVPLLGAAQINNGKVRYRLDPGLRRELKSPRAKAFISLRVQVNFNYVHSLNLYEKMCEAQRPCYSEWMTIEDFRIEMGVNNNLSYHDNTELKRTFLDKIVKEINDTSELFLTYVLEARGRGKTFTHIRFHIVDNPKYKPGSALDQYRDEQRARYEVLTGEFGLSDKELETIVELTGEHGDGRIDDAIQFTRFRMREDENYVKFPGKFLMKAISDGMRLPARDRAKLEKTGDGLNGAQLALHQASNAGTKQIKAKADKYETLSQQFDSAELAEHWREWSLSLPGATVLKSSKVSGAMQPSLENDSVKSNFCLHLEKHLKKAAKTKAKT